MRNMTEKLLTAPEVAEMLRVGKATVYRLVKKGELRGHFIGRLLRFYPDDVELYIGGDHGTEIHGGNHSGGEAHQPGSRGGSDQGSNPRGRNGKVAPNNIRGSSPTQAGRPGPTGGPGRQHAGAGPEVGRKAPAKRNAPGTRPGG